MTGFLYPRAISIFRLPIASGSAVAGFGAQPYAEPQTVANASLWASRPMLQAVPCSIQEYRSGQRPTDDLPGSTMVTPTTKIFIPARALQRGAVKVRDYVIDDLGIKYHVINPYWNSLGFRLYCVFLET